MSTAMPKFIVSSFPTTAVLATWTWTRAFAQERETFSVVAFSLLNRTGVSFIQFCCARESRGR